MNNGQEIWDAIGNASVAMLRSSKLNELLIEYRQTDRKVCGACDHWMKSSLCPRETNVKGHPSGPSMSGSPCKKFQLTEYVKVLKEERREGIMAFCVEEKIEVPREFRGDLYNI